MLSLSFGNKRLGFQNLYRKGGLCPDMNEKLLTGMLNYKIGSLKQRILCYQVVFFFLV